MRYLVFFFFLMLGHISGLYFWPDKNYEMDIWPLFGGYVDIGQEVSLIIGYVSVLLICWIDDLIGD